MGSLDGKVVLVTGASSGLGEAAARLMQRKEPASYSRRDAKTEDTPSKTRSGRRVEKP